MQKTAVALLALLFAAAGSAHGQVPQVGRYQMIAAPASQSQTFPETLLLDTATGQTWILYHETGQTIEWPSPVLGRKGSAWRSAAAAA